MFAGVATLLLACGALVGCGKSSAPNAPVVTYDPDLEALDAYLYWAPVPIPMHARDARRGGGAGVMRSAFDVSRTVVVGWKTQPAFRIRSQGLSGAYRTRFYIDDQLWWDVGGPAPVPQGIVDLYGKTWVPADTGVHVLRMVVDPDSLIAEVNETNNERRLEVKVIPGDLRCAISRFVQWRDGRAYEGDDVQVNTPVSIITLSASDAAYPNHRAVLRACGTTLLDHRVSLSGGFWGDFRFDTLQFTPSTIGACEIRFDVDPDHEFPMDRDRTNNTYVRTLTVRP